MKMALKRFPWFEVMLIVGLAVALIVKPQTTSQAGPATPVQNFSSGVGSVLPLSAATATAASPRS